MGEDLEGPDSHHTVFSFVDHILSSDLTAPLGLLQAYRGLLARSLCEISRESWSGIYKGLSIP